MIEWAGGPNSSRMPIGLAARTATNINDRWRTADPNRNLDQAIAAAQASQLQGISVRLETLDRYCGNGSAPADVQAIQEKPNGKSIHVSSGPEQISLRRRL